MAVMLSAGDSLIAVLCRAVHMTLVKMYLYIFGVVKMYLYIFGLVRNVLVPFCVKMYLYICGRRIELAVCVFSSSRLDATLVVLL